ncbi:MAG: gliding motility-associated ABC transporter substrate-binding protein GldG [Flavobacteriaceae bacterium]|jgi:gliding-associated putative ABC transporter substrate-binding component GldG|nr:gliding motility-associated ABC transporter substrate-binding protein GldG [Flavobacteriaceae bacterium]
MKKAYIKNVKEFFVFLGALIVLNAIGFFVYHRFDLTQDKRFTLSNVTEHIVDKVNKQIVVDVFLEGDFPQGFKRLQNETKQLLEELENRNPNIKFQFVNPLAEGDNQETLKELYKYGLKPVTITLNDKGVQSQALVFPWAMVSDGKKTVKVQLLKNLMGAETEDKVLVSVQHLEYAFADAIQKVVEEKQKKIAVLKGNGELDDVFMADFLMTARDSYHIAPFTLDSVASAPVKTLEQLKTFDLIVVAKPTKPFTEKQVEVLDQYVMNGGKSLWLLDQVQADFDSLRANGSVLAYNKDHSLGEMFFKYGLRLNASLVKDEIATPVKIAMGRQGSETQYGDFVWKYAPFVYPEGNHPIIKNIEGVKFDFTSPMDTLKNGLKKTVLFQSSKYSMLTGTPNEITLDILNEEGKPEMYEGKGNYILGVLLEGKFKSVFQNRVLPFSYQGVKYEGVENKMIVISDGDIISNQLDQNYQPLELGYDKWMNRLYGNKEFVMNAVNYLLDDNGLIQLRTKEVKIPMLDKMRVYQDYSFIQVIAIALPMLILVLAGVGFVMLRKRLFIRK